MNELDCEYLSGRVDYKRGDRSCFDWTRGGAGRAAPSDAVGRGFPHIRWILVDPIGRMLEPADILHRYHGLTEYHVSQESSTIQNFPLRGL